jgi:membrane protein DedA with SNARE-associated domain
MFGFLIITLFKPDIMIPVVEWIKSQIEFLGKWNYFLAFVSALAESLPIIGTIIPGQVIMLSVGGFYGSIWLAQFIWVLFCAILWSVISNAIGYFMGKKYGEDFFKHYGVWIGIEQTELKYLKKWVETWGLWGIILSKFHPHFRAFLPFIAGSMWFTKTRFWMSNIIASTLWAVFFITIGIFFAQHYEIIVKYIWWIMTGIMLAILGYYWMFQREKLMNYWREKNKEMEAKYSKK